MSIKAKIKIGITVDKQKGSGEMGNHSNYLGNTTEAATSIWETQRRLRGKCPMLHLKIFNNL